MISFLKYLIQTSVFPGRGQLFRLLPIPGIMESLLNAGNRKVEILSASIGQFTVLGAVAGFIKESMVFISEFHRKEHEEREKIEAITMMYILLRYRCFYFTLIALL